MKAIILPMFALAMFIASPSKAQTNDSTATTVQGDAPADKKDKKSCCKKDGDHCKKKDKKKCKKSCEAKKEDEK